jgi:hypothetical protein
MVRIAVPDPRWLRDTAAEVARTTRRLAALAPRMSVLLDAIEDLVNRLTAAVDELEGQLNGYLPALESLRPAISRLATTWGVAETDAFVHLVRQSPADLKDLVEASTTLNEIIGSVPGLARTKRRIDDELQRDA